MASNAGNSEITAGNGNDTIYVGRDNTVTVGTSHDSFIFEQTTPGNIGAVTVTGFDPGKDVITFSTQLTTSVSYHDNAEGNAESPLTMLGIRSRWSACTPPRRLWLCCQKPLYALVAPQIFEARW